MKKVFLGLLVAMGASAQQLQVDPAGNFSIVIPASLLPCDLAAGSLACPSKNPLLTVTIANVQAGSSVDLMALNAEDSIRDKQNFRMVNKETIWVDDNKVIVQTMTFNNLGNVTLPVVVRVEDAVLGTKAFELKVACNQQNCPKLLGSFDEAMNSLHLAQKGQTLRKEKSQGSTDGIKGMLKSFRF